MEFFVRFKAWHVYNMILMYITLFTNEQTRLRLIYLPSGRGHLLLFHPTIYPVI